MATAGTSYNQASPQGYGGYAPHLAQQQQAAVPRSVGNLPLAPPPPGVIDREADLLEQQKLAELFKRQQQLVHLNDQQRIAAVRNIAKELNISTTATTFPHHGAQHHHHHNHGHHHHHNAGHQYSPTSQQQQQYAANTAANSHFDHYGAATGARATQQQQQQLARDPYAVAATTRDPYAVAGANRDPYAAAGANRDPYAAAATTRDPYAVAGANRNTYAGANRDPYPAAANRDPYPAAANRDPYSAATRDPYGYGAMGATGAATRGNDFVSKPGGAAREAYDHYYDNYSDNQYQQQSRGTRADPYGPSTGKSWQ